jgi:hypothetical protein
MWAAMVVQVWRQAARRERRGANARPAGLDRTQNTVAALADKMLKDAGQHFDPPARAMSGYAEMASKRIPFHKTSASLATGTKFRLFFIGAHECPVGPDKNSTEISIIRLCFDMASPAKCRACIAWRFGKITRTGGETEWIP